MNADLRHTFRRFAEWSASCVRCAFHATTRRNVLSTGSLSAVSDSKVDICEQPVASIVSSKRPSGVAGELVRDLVAELGEAMFMRNRGPARNAELFPFRIRSMNESDQESDQSFKLPCS